MNTAAPVLTATGTDAAAVDQTRGRAALAIAVAPKRWSASLYHEAKRSEQLAQAAHSAAAVLEEGGRLAFFVSQAPPMPWRPQVADLMDAVEAAGLNPRAEIVWDRHRVEDSQAAGVWRSPHNPPLRSVAIRILVAESGSRHRWGGPTERRLAGLEHVCDIDAACWHRDTSDIWRPTRPALGTDDDQAPQEAIERLMRLHTYVGEKVTAVLGGQRSTAAAARATGRRMVTPNETGS